MHFISTLLNHETVYHIVSMISYLRDALPGHLVYWAVASIRRDGRKQTDIGWI